MTNKQYEQELKLIRNKLELALRALNYIAFQETMESDAFILASMAIDNIEHYGEI